MTMHLQDNGHPAAGFSIVELLVVIAIIAALLGLLVVGINRSFYAAQLARCGANLKGMAGGVQTYAAGNKRSYPVPPEGRTLFPNLIGGTHPIFVRNDLRPLVEGYFSFGLFLCPLSPEISVRYEDTDPDGLNESFVFSNYNLWYGWRYQPEGEPVEAGMFRMGDRWSWKGDKFRALASDYDRLFPEGADASHPDDEGLLAEELHQNDEGGTASSWSRYQENPPANLTRRGLLDTNTAFDDASVKRFSNVKVVDERMKQLPQYDIRNSLPDMWLNVPLN